MHNEQEKKSLREYVLGVIERGEVKMRPKWHFAFRAALYATGGIVLLLILIYLVSFIAFVLRQTGVLFEPSFGSRGWFAFFGSLPWILVLLSAAFIVILEILVRRYAFAYRRPLLYTALAIILIAIAGGTLVSQTRLHGRLFQYAREDRLPVPFAGRMYRGFGGQRFMDIHRGAILEVGEGGFVLDDVRGGTSSIAVSPMTRMPPDGPLSAGESVIIFGEREGEIIRAFGVRRIGSEENEIFRVRMR